MSSAITGMLFTLFFLIVIASPFMVLPYAISFFKGHGVDPGRFVKPLAAIAAVAAVAIGYALVTVPYLYLILIGFLLMLAPIVAACVGAIYVLRHLLASRSAGS